MCASVEEDVFDASVGQELEGVFDQRRIGKRQKALRKVSRKSTLSVAEHTLGFSRVRGSNLVSNVSASTCRA